MKDGCASQEHSESARNNIFTYTRQRGYPYNIIIALVNSQKMLHFYYTTLQRTSSFSDPVEKVLSATLRW